MALVLLFVPLLVLSLVLKVLAVLLLRHRNPGAADVIERHWTWLPLVLMLVLLAVYAWPLAIVLVVVVTVVLLVRPTVFGLTR